MRVGKDWKEMQETARVIRMTKEEQFFYDNAGFSVKPGETEEEGHIRSAKALALAETWFNDQDWEYSLVPDEDADLSWMDEDERKQEHEVIGVVLNDSEGNHLPFSLWGIVDATDAYVRVIVAELASEAMYEANRLQDVCAD